MIKIANRFTKIIALLAICSVLVTDIAIVKGEDKMVSVWEPFSKWYEWKKTTKLTKEQRTVVDYFEKAGKIKDKVQDSRLNSMPPGKSIRIIKNYINDLKNIHSPKACIPYHEALTKELEIELEYHEGRKANFNDEELQKITLETLSVDGLQFTIFFQVIKDVGLLDDVEEEMKKIETTRKDKKR